MQSSTQYCIGGVKGCCWLSSFIMSFWHVRPPNESISQKARLMKCLCSFWQHMIWSWRIGNTAEAGQKTAFPRKGLLQAGYWNTVALVSSKSVQSSIQTTTCLWTTNVSMGKEETATNYANNLSYLITESYSWRGVWIPIPNWKKPLVSIYLTFNRGKTRKDWSSSSCYPDKFRPMFLEQ